MERIEAALRQALIETGRIGPKDRIEIIEKSIGTSEYARFGLYVYHGRKKEAFVYWNLCVDMTHETVSWDGATFYYI